MSTEPFIRGGLVSDYATTHPVRWTHWPSMASIAANFRSTCGSERGAPDCSTQLSPAATPHVGQGTEDNCSGVSSFFFIRAGYSKTWRKTIQLGTLGNSLGIRSYPRQMARKIK